MPMGPKETESLKNYLHFTLTAVEKFERIIIFLTKKTMDAKLGKFLVEACTIFYARVFHPNAPPRVWIFCTLAWILGSVDRNGRQEESPGVLSSSSSALPLPPRSRRFRRRRRRRSNEIQEHASVGK